MSTPMSHHPLAPLGSRRMTWFVLAGLAIAGVTVAFALMFTGSKSPDPVRAVPAPAAVSAPSSAVSRAVPYRSRFEHGMPSLNPHAQRTTPARHSTPGAAAPTAHYYPPNLALRKEGFVRRTGR